LLIVGVVVGAPSIVLLALPSRAFADLLGAFGGIWMAITAAAERRLRQRST